MITTKEKAVTELEQNNNDNPRVRTRVVAEQADLAVAWCCAALVGAVAISLIPEHFGKFRMIVPIGLMGIYLAFAYARTTFSTERVADSVYFMGFLWTLWALIDVLLWQADLSAAQLYVAFGYSLTATAMGMFLRLLLLQFYRTIDDQEQQAVDTIDAHVKRLVGELSLSAAAVAAFRPALTRIVEQSGRDMLAGATSAAQDLRRAGSLVADEAQGLAGSLNGVREAVGSTGRMFAALEKRLGTSTTKVGAAVEGAGETLEGSVRRLSQRVEAIQVEPDVIQGKVAQMAEAASASLQPLVVASTKALQELTNAVTQVSEAIATIGPNGKVKGELELLVTNVQAAGRSCGELAARADEASAQLSQIPLVAKQAAAEVVDACKGVGQQLSRTGEEVEKVNGSVIKVGGSAKEVSTMLHDVVRFVQSTVTAK